MLIGWGSDNQEKVKKVIPFLIVGNVALLVIFFMLTFIPGILL
jgi:hypothetical protein